MFNTDINHWLQSFESGPLTFFLQAVSLLGLTYPIILITLIVISGIHLRKGWILLNIVAMTAFFTIWAKEIIDYPRPLAVDPGLESFQEDRTTEDLTSLQPHGMFEVFSTELLQKIRDSSIGRYGFPSGHTSIQVALWGGMALLFSSTLLRAWAVLFVFLTMWSRMYLGVHYAGDVLGGLLLGLLLTIGIYHIGSYALKKGSCFLTAFCLLIVFPWSISNSAGNWQATLLLGVNMAWLVSIRDQDWRLSARAGKKLLSTLTLIFLFLSLFVLSKKLTSGTGNDYKELFMGLAGFLSSFLYFFIAQKMNWIQINKTSHVRTTLD